MNFDPELLRSWLGTAASTSQIQRTAAFTTVWTAVSFLAEKGAPASLVDKDERTRFAGRVTGLAHSLSTCFLALRIVWRDEEDTKNDHLYGFSDSTNFLFAHSCAFFLWDIKACFSMSKIDFGFVIHAIACFLCYLFGQFPYLHYYGVRFLLFELSTPFLNTMLIMRQLGIKKGHDLMQNLFGYSFLGCRILYGFPLSAMFFRETIGLLQQGKPHSLFVVCYYLVANCALNGLNLFWLVSMLKKRNKSS